MNRRIRWRLRGLLVLSACVCVLFAAAVQGVRQRRLVHDVRVFRHRQEVCFYRDWSSSTPERVGAVINGEHVFFNDYARILDRGHELTVRATDCGLTVFLDGRRIECQNVRVSPDWSSALFDEDNLFERIGIGFDLDQLRADRTLESEFQPRKVRLAVDPS